MASSDSRRSGEERNKRLWEKCGRVYITEKVFNKCYPDIKEWISIKTVITRMMACDLITSYQANDITNKFLSHEEQLTNLIQHVSRCGRHGFFLFYVCLFESKDDHMGHGDACDELSEKAIEMGVKAPWDKAPPSTRPPTAALPPVGLVSHNLREGESVERDQVRPFDPAGSALHTTHIQNQDRSGNSAAVGTRDVVPIQTVQDDGKKQVDIRLIPYTLSATKSSRGLALIINNYQFSAASKLSDRTCGQIDGGKLIESFQNCGYRIRLELNKTAEEIVGIFRSLLPLKTAQAATATSNGIVHEDDDSFVCCIVSHGTWNEERRQDFVYGSDGQPVSVQQLALDYLNVTPDSDHSDRQNLLNKKPKLFFVHACRGEDLTPLHVSADGDKSDKKSLPHLPQVNVFPIPADFLFSYPVVPGTKAFRHDSTGTFFITRLCEAIKDLKDKLDVVFILKRVHYDLTTGPSDVYIYEDQGKEVMVRHCPQLISTLRGPFFLTKDAEKKYEKYIK